MKDFNSLSGPWIGFSIDRGLRISEKISLSIRDGQISGTGSDQDGKFELTGFYKSRTQAVMITRVYTWNTNPSQDSVGTAFDYVGAWDGTLASGRWHQRVMPEHGGEFEMWPDLDEDLSIESLGLGHEEPLALTVHGS